MLVFTSPQAGTSRLPSMWIMGAYRSLPRPFRKHVQHIVLVRPSGARPACAGVGRRRALQPFPALLLRPRSSRSVPHPPPPAPAPAAFLRAVLAFMRPFVSRKAHRKIKLVASVHELAGATEGEVTLQSLGPAFLAEHLAAEEAAGAAACGGAADGGSSGNASP